MSEYRASNNSSFQLSRGSISETVSCLEIAYNAALILIHRPLLVEASNSKAGKSSLTVATTAAAAISRLVRDLGATQEISRIAPQIIDYVSIAAIMHLLNATSGRSRLGRQSANNLRVCVQALSQMVLGWKKRASNSLRHIQNLAQRWEVVWALPLQYSQVVPLQPQARDSDNGPTELQTPNFYDIFDDAAWDIAAETLLGQEEFADWDCSLHSGLPPEDQIVFEHLDWQLPGE